MKWLPALLLYFLLFVPGVGAQEVFYIAGAQGIYRDSLNVETGKLTTATLLAPGQDPNFLAFSPDEKFLYVTADKTVAAFGVQSDGGLIRLNEVPSGGDGACHVQLDKTGHEVFVADYNSGDIAGFGIKPDGSLGEREAFVRFTGSGPNPTRQTMPHAHSVYMDPDNRLLYACDLGSDRVWIFKRDSLHGALLPADPSSAQLPPGSGPRHLAFHPKANFVYVANEMGVSVTAFSRDTTSGALTPLQTVPVVLPVTPTVGVTTAEIICHPSGQWLYVSSRGSDTIAVLAIGSDGRLKLVQEMRLPVRFPRSFDLDPSGRWLVVGGQKDNRIAVLKIDAATGKLTATDQVASLDDPTCVLFAPAKKSL